MRASLTSHYYAPGSLPPHRPISPVTQDPVAGTPLPWGLHSTLHVAKHAGCIGEGKGQAPLPKTPTLSPRGNFSCRGRWRCRGEIPKLPLMLRACCWLCSSYNWEGRGGWCHLPVWVLFFFFLSCQRVAGHCLHGPEPDGCWPWARHGSRARSCSGRACIPVPRGSEPRNKGSLCPADCRGPRFCSA